MIKLIGIEKIYDSPSGKVHALKGIDLDIARGEIYGIIDLQVNAHALYRHLRK